MTADRQNISSGFILLQKQIPKEKEGKRKQLHLQQILFRSEMKESFVVTIERNNNVPYILSIWSSVALCK